MQAFKHIASPLRVFHGEECLGSLGAELDRLGSRRAVVFCGGSLVREARSLDAIRAAMGNRCCGVYAGVVAHSPLDRVQEASRELQRLEADAVVAVGGGSAVVTARAASILLAEGHDAHALCTARGGDGKLRSPRLLAPKLPQIVIPTTPTTATVKAGSAVLDPHDGRRLALFDPKTRAKAVFVDAQLLATPPASLVVSASLNTLAMAVEGLLSRKGDPFSDALLMHAVRLLAHNLPLMAGRDSVEVRAALMMASILCGHGTDATGAGIAIPLGHAISSRFHIDNGITNAILLPGVLRFNASHAAAGIEKLATALGLHAASLIDDFDRLLRTVEIPMRLRDVGVAQDAIPDLAAVSMDDWFVRDNPRPVTHARELEAVLHQAW